MTEVTIDQLEEKYVGKVVRYSRFLGTPIYGMVEQIGLEDWKNPVVVVFQIGDQRFTEDFEDFEELITIL